MSEIKELIQKYGILEELQSISDLNSACPVAKVHTQFSPEKIIGVAKENPEELIRNPMARLCLACGGCKENSGGKINMSHFIRDIRSLAFEAGFKGTETHGGSIITAQRMCYKTTESSSNNGWIPESLNVNTQNGEYLYWAGNAPLFDAAIPDLANESLKSARAAIRLLNCLEIAPVVLQQYHSSGHDLLWTGDKELFQKCAMKNVKEIEETGVETIIVSSPEDYYTFTKDYKEFISEFSYQVCHISEIVAENIEKFNFKKSNTTVTYHDPCKLGRGMGVYDAPRQILGSIPGLEFKEMKNNRESSMCCGTSCWSNCNKYSKLMQIELLQEAVDTGADSLITSCLECAIHFRCAMQSSAWQQVSINVSDLSVFAVSLL